MHNYITARAWLVPIYSIVHNLTLIMLVIVCYTSVAIATKLTNIGIQLKHDLYSYYVSSYSYSYDLDDIMTFILVVEFRDHCMGIAIAMTLMIS